MTAICPHIIDVPRRPGANVPGERTGAREQSRPAGNQPARRA
jgi:hypothetical protein